MRISDWSSDVCSSDLHRDGVGGDRPRRRQRGELLRRAALRRCARQVRRLGQPEDLLPAARGDQPDRRRRRHRRDRPRRHAAARGAPRSLGEQRGGQELMISFSQIEFWNWWVIAVFLIGIEVFAPGAVFLWMGIAAGVVGFVLLALPQTPWQIQILVFAGVSLATIWVWRTFLRHRFAKPDRKSTRLNSSH